jgi:hypothetical protein
VKEFKFVQLKGQVLFKGVIITKMSKWSVSFLLKNYEARKAEFYMKALWFWTPEGQNNLGQREIKCIGKIFLCGPRFLRWAMWPMGLLCIKPAAVQQGDDDRGSSVYSQITHSVELRGHGGSPCVFHRGLSTVGWIKLVARTVSLLN